MFKLWKLILFYIFIAYYRQYAIVYSVSGMYTKFHWNNSNLSEICAKKSGSHVIFTNLHRLHHRKERDSEIIDWRGNIVKLILIRLKKRNFTSKFHLYNATAKCDINYEKKILSEFNRFHYRKHVNQISIEFLEKLERYWQKYTNTEKIKDDFNRFYKKINIFQKLSKKLVIE